MLHKVASACRYFNGAALRSAETDNKVEMSLKRRYNFNGAALTEARKPWLIHKAERNLIRTSMGPRSRKRGNHRAGFPGIPSLILQWGRALGSAETSAATVAIELS